MDRGANFWRNEVVAFLVLSTIKGVGYWTLILIHYTNTGHTVKHFGSAHIPIVVAPN